MQEGVEVIADYLRNSPKVDLVPVAASIIINCTSDDRDIQEAFGASGTIQSLVDIYASYSDQEEVRSSAALAIAALCTGEHVRSV